MRSPLTLLIVLVVAFAAGCGGDDAPPKPKGEEAAVIKAVADAGATFLSGDYAKTCSFYTVDLVVQLIKSTNAKNCKEVWGVVDTMLKQTNTPEIRKAIVAFGPESAVIKGDVATATFGKPPKILEKVFPNAKGRTMQLRKVGGRWIISVLPALG